MKPGIFHKLLARLLVIDCREHSYLKDDKGVKSLKQQFFISDLTTMAYASTEAYFFWPLTICGNCGRITHHGNPHLVVAVCTNCHTTQQSFYSGAEYRASWTNRELIKLPTRHKLALIEAIKYGEYIRTNNGNSANAEQSSDNLG